MSLRNSLLAGSLAPRRATISAAAVLSLVGLSAGAAYADGLKLERVKVFPTGVFDGSAAEIP